MFVHLRLHSEFSVVDSTCRIDDVVKIAAKDAQPALAITDLNNLFGTVKFYKEGRGKGVKPIIGAEIHLEGLGGDAGATSRVVLLVQNHPGYLNLCELLARAWTQNIVKGLAVVKLAWLKELSEGLILLTNDGDLTFRATHPSFGLEKTYIIEFDGILPTGVDKVLLKGVELEDGMGRVLTFKQLSPRWIEVSIHEGRYHIIRRLMEAVGVDVLRLIRTKFGPISLGDTPEGRWRDLNDGELMNLRKALNI